ncbi:membrane metalloprotease [Joostella sp. CR20]|uniref:membrane metalloprotease n=1 Tax=Joostella sp. CR20 TaxID=2804312 RepID=UPI00313B5F74
MKPTLKMLLYALLVFIVACSSDDGALPEENNLINVDNRQSTGDSAFDFLSEENFTNLFIEVVYVEGFEPSEESLNNLVSFINQRCYKSEGIQISKRAIPSTGKSSYTVEEIDKLEKDVRIQYNSNKQLALFALFLNGSYNNGNEDAMVLGVAYRNTSFVIFEEEIHNFNNTITGSNLVLFESTVLRHEFCHLLGLVDLGSEMQTDHLDTENGHHCNVESCLMNHEIEFGFNLGNVASEANIPQLDDHCLADLRANGGR